MIIKNIIFVLVGVLLVIGFFNERKVIDFEDRFVKALMYHIGQRQKKKLAQKERAKQAAREEYRRRRYEALVKSQIMYDPCKTVREKEHSVRRVA